MLFGKMQIEFEKELCERVEEVMVEAKTEFKARMRTIVIMFVFS